MKVFELFSLKDRTALITGGCGMLGTLYTATLAKAGASVVALDKKADEAKFFSNLRSQYDLNEEELKRVVARTCDITDAGQVEQAVEEANQRFGNIRVLINNASLVKQVGADSALEEVYKPFLKQTKKDWEEYFFVDLTGTIHMCQKTIPHMLKGSGGSIINISSTYGIQSPDQRLYDCFNNKLTDEQKRAGVVIEKPLGYSVSKSGILNLTRHLATQYARQGIRVNTLTPGGVFAGNPQDFVEAYSARTPLGRMSSREDYIGPMLFLASDASSYVTGSNLVVDGGWSVW